MLNKLVLFMVLIQQQTTFHPKQYKAINVFPAQVQYHRGMYQRVTGPVSWLLPYLWYDEVGKVWEVQEGSRIGWNWTVLRDGDIISIDSEKVILIQKVR